MSFHLHITGLLLLSGLFLLSDPKPINPPPTLVSPANGAVMDNGCQNKPEGITWDFDWNDVPGATEYHIKVWRNPNIPLINNMSVPSSSFNYVSQPTDYIINSNLDGWRWMVRAKVRGQWGHWSVVRFFRVERLNADCP